jgi:hypothetical protein
MDDTNCTVNGNLWQRSHYSSLFLQMEEPSLTYNFSLPWPSNPPQQSRRRYGRNTQGSVGQT